VRGRTSETAANFRIYKISIYILFLNIRDLPFEYLAVDFGNIQGGVKVT
jgi:hypothetical protein